MILAHLNHWWSPLVMIAPAAMTVIWLRTLNRREEQERERSGGRAARFGAPAVIRELWTVQLVDGEWRLDSTVPVEAPTSEPGPNAPPTVTSPWNM
jgi:hypothetical protein